MSCIHLIFTFFFFNDTATTEIYTLSLHDALPICIAHRQAQEFTESQNKLREAEQLARASHPLLLGEVLNARGALEVDQGKFQRSEEHTSELQSQSNLVCRLLLEKKKNKTHIVIQS